MTEPLDTTGTVAAPSAADSSVGDSGLAAKLSAAIDSLNTKVDNFAKTVQTIQSGKDKSVAKVESEVGEIRAMLADYEKLKERLGPDGAVEQLELKQTLSSIQAQLHEFTRSVPAAGAGNVQGETAEAAKVISGYGFSDSDPSVAHLYSLKGDALKAAAADMAFRRATQTTSPADASALSSGKAPSTQSIEALTSEYQKNMKAAQGKPTDARAIKEKYRSLGVPVDQVVFH